MFRYHVKHHMISCIIGGEEKELDTKMEAVSERADHCADYPRPDCQHCRKSIQVSNFRYAYPEYLVLNSQTLFFRSLSRKRVWFLMDCIYIDETL